MNKNEATRWHKIMSADGSTSVPFPQYEVEEDKVEQEEEYNPFKWGV